ncbi:MAG: arylsulfatase [Bacteroidetes bacterium GWF2_41_9]|nr:MAG: arylsulfatase [Bacteroidetes bacterium GWF2_41_9]
MINLKSVFSLGMATLTTVNATSQKTTVKKPETPNIIIILMDDMGYGDIGRTGANQYETPNLNKLANQGMQFTWWYCPQAVSSASRAGLITGCYPNRIGFSGALMPWAEVGINPEETTIAEILKTKGYRTSVIGKWHLGHHEKFLPLQHGFDEYYGIPYSNDMWPVDFDGVPVRLKDTTHRLMRYPALPLINGNEKVAEVPDLAGQDKLTTDYTERAVKFIEKNKNRHFFLYIPHSMVHIPLGVSDKFRGKSKQGLYGDVMMEVDWSIGEIMKALERNGLEKNTLVIFTSDNGPWLNFGNHAGNTAGLREGKGTSWEGGQRVPCIMRWPGVIPPGDICTQLASSIDILPTLAAITGAALPENKIDGVNILSLIKGDKEATPRRDLYYYYQQNSLEGVQHDFWKLVLPHSGRTYRGHMPGNDGWPGQTGTETVTTKQLYDLRRDPGEWYDVSELYPEKVKELEELAEKARKDIGDDITKVPGANRRKIGSINE